MPSGVSSFSRIKARKPSCDNARFCRICSSRMSTSPLLYLPSVPGWRASARSAEGHHVAQIGLNEAVVALLENSGMTRKAQRNVSLGRRRSARLGPALGVAPHRIVTAIEAEIAQSLENSHQRQALSGWLRFLRGKQSIQLLPPGAELRHRLDAAS